MMDLLVSLYFGELRIRPEEPDWPDRDRFILSKGHAAIGLYSVLALRGFLPLEELATFDKGDSRLQGHPDVTRLPGLDASTGSLGQGLSVGVGMALGARLAGKDFHTWVLLGDGEIQEGMVWEAVQVAARYKLTNLTAIVDRNGLQQFGLPSTSETTHTDRGDRRDPWFGVDLSAVFQAFGWRVDRTRRSRLRPDRQLLPAGPGRRLRRPADRAVAHTVKGKGLSLAEGVHTWHSIVPTQEDFEKARQELDPDEIELLDSYDQDRQPAQRRRAECRHDRDARRLGRQAGRARASDPRTVVLDGDLANSTKADKFAKAHPDRFFQMGIAEQNLIGAAAGLAASGYVPWTSSFTVFFTHRAIDPIRMLVAQSHANVKIVGSYSGLLIGAVGKTHLDIEDLAIMRAMPDMAVLAPADAVELLAMMDWAQAYDGPVYLRIVRDAVPDLFGADYTFMPGAIHQLRDGGRVSADFHRPADRAGARGRRAARRAGIDASVIHVPSIKPIDEPALVDAVTGADWS